MRVMENRKYVWRGERLRILSAINQKEPFHIHPSIR